MRTALVTIPLALIGCYEGYDTDDDGGGRVPDPIVDVPGADIASDAQECDLVMGNLTVSAGAELDEAPEFSCWDLAGTLTLQGPNVTSLANLKHLRSVAGLVIMDTALTTLDPHRTIEVLGAMNVEGNSQLTSLVGLRFEVLEEPIGSFLVTDNDALTNLGELDQVAAVSTDLTIDNSALAAIAFPKLKSAKVITLKGNADLESVELPALTSLVDLIIQRNRELVDLSFSDLEGLKSIEVFDNDALTTLAGFSVLRDMSGSLAVEDNSNLTNLGILTHLRSLNFGATVVGNGRLSQCIVDELDACVSNIGPITSSGNMAVTPCPTHWCM